MQLRRLTRGACRKPGVVIVVVIGPPLRGAVALGFLIVRVGQAADSKRAVVKPVIAHPAVDHGVDRNRGAQRRVRME
jgi:hypothetical protein